MAIVKCTKMSIRRNYIYNTANQLLTMLVSIITVPYVSRILGAENIGIYSYTYSVVSYFVMFIALGLNNYGNREIAKVQNDSEELNKTFSSVYAMQLIIGLLVLSIYIVFVLIFTKQYKWFFAVEIIYIIAAIIDINWAMYGLEEFKFTAVRNMIISVINLILIIAFVRDERSLYIYILILAGGTLANQITAWVYIKKRISYVKVTFLEVFQHIKPNIILFIPIIAVSIYKIMDKIMLGNMVNIEQVGFYESSEKIIRIPTIMISSLGTVMLPRMSKLYADNEITKVGGYICKSVDIAMGLSSSLCFGIMAVSKEFVPLFYGEGYETCIYIYLVLLPSCVFLAFSNIIRTQYLIPAGRDSIFIKAVILGAIVNVVINLIMIPHLLAIGAAIGTIMAETVVCISQAMDIRKELPIWNYIKRGIPFVLLGIVMFCVVYPITLKINNIFALIIKAFCGALIYMGGILIIFRLKQDVYEINVKDVIHKIYKR